MNNKSGSESCCSGYPNCKCMVYPMYPTVDVSSLTNEIDRLQKLCEEQKGEIERLKKDWLNLSHILDQVTVERHVAESQLAEHTERMRRLEGALSKIANPKEWPHKPCEDVANWMSELAEQALNQDSLGDGGKEG